MVRNTDFVLLQNQIFGLSVILNGHAAFDQQVVKAVIPTVDIDFGQDPPELTFLVSLDCDFLAHGQCFLNELLS